MAKAVFTHRESSQYDDDPAFRYHFPKTYLNRVERAIGDWILYYEPRRGSGRLSYYAAARVRSVEPDPAREDHYYARITDYLGFPRPVPLNENGVYRETRAQKQDGTANRGLLGHAVREISDADFDSILTAGLTTDPAALGVRQSPETVDGFAETTTPFQRSIVQQLTNRKFRDAAFARGVKAAYQNKCALSGLSLTNGGGRPEVEAAHIRPVADDGPDTIRNGLALSHTLHWMFDRGLVSVDEDFSILLAKDKLPQDSMDRLIVPDRRLILPVQAQHRPAQSYLDYHRREVFCG